MYKDYQTQSVLLPEDMKKKKEQEIVDKEKEAKGLQKQRFGVDGDLFKKRQELVKPIQEKVYNAIQDIATNNNYMVIFDKAGSLTMLYVNPKYDLSDEVLDNLGAAMSGRKGRNQAGDKGGSYQQKSGTYDSKTGGKSTLTGWQSATASQKSDKELSCWILRNIPNFATFHSFINPLTHNKTR